MEMVLVWFKVKAVNDSISNSRSWWVVSSGKRDKLSHTWCWLQKSVIPGSRLPSVFQFFLVVSRRQRYKRNTYFSFCSDPIAAQICV